MDYSQKEKVYVLDSSAFICGFSEIPSVTIKDVREELKRESVYRFEVMVGKGMAVVSPSKESIDRIIKKAKESGDIDDLSKVDLKLIAVALEIDGVLVTDDYSMQNVAKMAGIDVKTIRYQGIDEEIVWMFKCVDCGRIYDEKINCRVCGGKTEKTKRNSNRKN